MTFPEWAPCDVFAFSLQNLCEKHKTICYFEISSCVWDNVIINSTLDSGQRNVPVNICITACVCQNSWFAAVHACLLMGVRPFSTQCVKTSGLLFPKVIYRKHTQIRNIKIVSKSRESCESTSLVGAYLFSVMI